MTDIRDLDKEKKRKVILEKIDEEILITECAGPFLSCVRVWVNYKATAPNGEEFEWFDAFDPGDFSDLKRIRSNMMERFSADPLFKNCSLTISPAPGYARVLRETTKSEEDTKYLTDEEIRDCLMGGPEADEMVWRSIRGDETADDNN